MAQKSSKLSHLLARVNYPMYCVRTLSERHILVAGGGGPAKTGIANTLEIYELIYDPNDNSCKARLITHYDTGSRAVMNLCVVDKSNYCYQLFCGGMDGMCTQYDLKLNVESKRRQSSSSPTRRDRTFSETSLRRRRLSSKSESTDKENDINANNSQTSGETDPQKTHSRKDSKPNISNDSNGVPDFTFDIKQQKIFKTDFSAEEPFQKIVKFSPEANVLITGGSDGHIRLWSYPKVDQIFAIKAHTNEVDDFDINPNGTQIVSVSRDGKGFVWNTSDGRLITELKYQLPVDKSSQNNNKNGVIPNTKYIFRTCRFTTVEGDLNNFKLYTIMNPLVNCKPPKSSYICRWNTQTYSPEKLVSAGVESLSTMAISDDGRYVGLGTLNGSVDVYISFSLQRIYHLSSAHNIFVTGVEFLKSSEAAQQLTGGNDASLVSVSVDNHIVVHQIPKRATLGFLGSTTFFIVFMLIVYTLMSYLGL